MTEIYRPQHTHLLRDWFLRQNGLHIGMGAGDDMYADDFAFDRLDGLGAGVGGSFDRGDIANDNRRDQGVADLGHGADEFDIRGFEHGIGALDESNQSAGFNES